MIHTRLQGQVMREFKESKPMVMKSTSVTLDAPANKLGSRSKVIDLDVPIYLKVQGIKKSFKDNTVLKGIDMEVGKGEVVCLLGPSGSGKSTFLRCLNLLERADEGTVIIDGYRVDLTSLSGSERLAYQRQTAMVFQNYGLFYNHTAKENIVLPLVQTQGKSRADATILAEALLGQVGLGSRMNFYPSQLSGGQQQRVGIARALALNPKVILFDEPTSALDPEWVKETLHLLKDIAEMGMTMVLVTHEMDFAYDVADKVIFMEKGHIVEQGEARAFFENPQQERTKEFLARFTGH